MGNTLFIFAGIIGLFGAGYLIGFRYGAKFVVEKLKEKNE